MLPYPLRTFSLLKLFSAPHIVWKMPPSDHKVYLTFDDGPHPDITPWVLKVLNDYGWKATFFCVGDNVEKYPDLFKQIIAEGHQVGNHTFNHLSGWKTPTNNYLDNIKKCASLVESNLFRPPYGRIRKKQSAQVAKSYKIVMWSMITGDYEANLRPQKVLQKLQLKTKAGDIVVFHDSLKAKENLHALLPDYLAYLNQHQFKPGCF
jgi:peptidoglycan/xylan/chitin deacetylase (PgdA/CDA1 family)